MVHSGKRGRPATIIDPEFLREALSSERNISVNRVARILGLHRHTVVKYMKQYGIKRSISDLSNDELDEILRKFHEHRPDSGTRYAVGFLRKMGHRVSRHRVRQALRRIDALSAMLRQQTSVVRRVFQIGGPNQLCQWSCDGHHKLIKYGFVIHGFIDTYCRMVS